MPGTSRVAILLAGLGVCAASVGVETRAAAQCDAIIGAEGAQRIFDALAHLKPADGCTLENVATERSSMKIEWKKGDTLEEAIVVQPASCVRAGGASNETSAMVPPATRSACPGAVEATLSVVENRGLGDVNPEHGVDVRGHHTPKRQVLALAAGIVAVVSAFAATLRWRERRRA
jgi:hypothetical protein